MAFLLLALVGGVNSVWADDITITWPMVDAQNATTQAGSANADGVVTVNNALLSTSYTSLAWADSKNLSYSDGAAGDNGNYKFYAGGVAITNNPNTDNDNASVNTNCYVKFSFTVAAGKKFTPKGFSFDCGRAGTDAGCVQGALVLADDSKSTSSIVRPTRSDKKNVYDSHVSKTITGAGAFDGGSTVNFYIYIGGKLASKTLYLANVTITGTYETPATPPGAISFSPAAGSVAEGTSITLTSSEASTIVYQWGESVVGEGGDWSSATTYSGSSKPVVPAAGTTNTVLSVKATNAYGDTFGSATYTPVKMAMKTIYSFADVIGSQEVTSSESDATIDGTSVMSIINNPGRIKLSPATGFQFKNGDAIEFSGSIGNASKKYGIKYGPTTDLGKEDLYVAAGQPCHVSGTLSLASATNVLYISRYDGSTTRFTTFTIRRQTAATSVAFNGVKINGSDAVEDKDYTMEGTVITLTAAYTEAPSVYLVNHIVFADESVEDQNVLVSFGNPDGTYFTGTAVIDGTTYTVKAPCGQINALKVEYKDGGTTVKEEHLDVTGLKVGASYTVPFRMYVEKDGALYQTTKNGSNPYYGDAVTLEYNTTVTKSVSSVDLGGGTLVLFEDLDGATGDNANIRASNCSAYNNTAYTSASNLPAGEYTFIVKAMNKGRGSSIAVGSTTVAGIADIVNKDSWGDKTFTNVNVPADGKLTLVKGGNNTIDCYDIIIAIRTGYVNTSINLNASGYATYSTDYDVEVSGAKAYTAELDFANETITCKEIGSSKVPAGNGVLLYGEANAEVTLTPTADADALGTNNLKATTNADGTLVTKGSNTYYALSGDTFKEYTGDNFVHHKAFFEVEGGVVQARNFTIVFDEESTGINEVKHGAISNNRFYNLNGQEVAQPTKGLYIMNGKKVIIK